MSAVPLPSTISQQFENARLPFIRWAVRADLHPQAEALLRILGVRTARSDMLAIVLHRLAHASGLLQQWSEDGAELCGLARLADALKSSPELLAALPGRAAPASSEILRHFHGQAESHYLYACWTVRDPVRPAARAWIDTLRIWLLVKNLQRATENPIFLRERNLEIAATRLRIASEENVDTPWLTFFERISGPTAWHALERHIHALDPRLFGPIGGQKGEEQPFLRQLQRIQSGEAPRPVHQDHEVEPLEAASLRLALDLASIPESAVGEVDADQAPQPQTLNLREDEDEDDELGAYQLPADPNQSPAEQEAIGRSIQLLSGADARYLAWDWYGLTPPETGALVTLINQTLARDIDASTALLAAVTWIAMHTGRSLAIAENFTLGSGDISTPSDADWLIDIDVGVMKRTAPRRSGHWKPGEDSARSVTPEVDWVQALDSRIREQLQRASMRALEPRTLGDLWPTNAGQSMRSAFRQWTGTAHALRRVTQGMLSQHLGRALLESTGDHVLTRLASAPASAGLPASTAYTAYRLEHTSLLLPGMVGQVGQWNVAGSRLDPHDELLAVGFHRAHARVKEHAAGRSAIEYHNAVTHYWDAQFRAATGVRPYFERWLDFSTVDQGLEFVVIDDKAGLGSTTTRLVPLPSGLITRFRTSYLETHLPALNAWLARHGVLTDAEQPTHSQSRPFLFLLRETDGVLERIPVASLTPEDDLMPEWPLPRRTFRHWLRTRLHRAEADPEIIDSMFGHRDGATSTHGDYSMRIWRDDAMRIRPFIEDALRTLDIPLLSDASSFESFGPPGAIELRTRTEPQTEAARASSRWRLQIRGARDAMQILSRELKIEGDLSATTRLTLKEIEQRLGNAGDAQVLDGLGRRLMQSAKGGPATLGPIRYGFFIALLERTWERHGKRPPLKRRFLFRPKDDSPFRASAANALTRRNELIELFNETLKDLIPSKMTRTSAVWIAIIDIALSSRCSDRALHKIIVNRNSFRLIRIAGEHHLEWNAHGDVSDKSSPIQRLRISSLAADALTRVLTASQTRVSFAGPLPDILKKLATSLGSGGEPPATLETVCEALCDLTEQCNAIELPGIVTAWLAGRVRSASLHWGDWMALRFEQRRKTRTMSLVRREQKSSKDASHRPLFSLVQMPHTGEVESDDQCTPIPRRRATPALGTDAERARQQARRFFKALRAELTRTEPVEGFPQPKSETSYRRNIRNAIERLVDTWSGSISSSVAALAQWCASLLDREYSGGLVALSTVERYFDALAIRFETAGSNVDLLAMDAEEIEDFYQTLLQLRAKSRRSYPAARLQEFHRFAEQILGLPDIDWSEVLAGEPGQLCAPGFIEETTFRRLLIHLARSPAFATDDERLAAQALVVLTYRAGLRGMEALGLLKDDIHFDGDLCWVAIDKNRLRGLKTFSARRTVPLLHLQPLESRLLRRLYEGAGRIARGHAGPHYLFTDPLHHGVMLEIERIRRLVNLAIKEVAGQDHLTIHHLRHSFANRVFWELECSRFSGPEWTEKKWEESSPCVQRLLGLTSVGGSATRRAPWALARLLGHAHVHTTIFSYVHVIGELAMRLAFKSTVPSWQPPAPEMFMDLNSLPELGTVTRAYRPQKQRLEAQHLLAMLSDLDSGLPAARLPGRYPIERDAALRFGKHARADQDTAASRAARRGLPV